MRKQTGPNDSKKGKTSEAKALAKRGRVPQSNASPSSVACSSYTLPISSQIGISKNQWASLKGKVGIDWFQLAACVEWNESVSDRWFSKLRDAKEVAQEQRRPASLTIGPDTVSVTSSGIGGGNDAYKETQIVWNEVRVGLSERNDATRQLSNASMQVSGTPCLITGAGVAWDFFVRLVRNIGGRVTDEWLRRLDICIDIPELNFAEALYTVLLNGHVNSRCRGKKIGFDDTGENATTYATGKSNRLRVSIYDKLYDCLRSHDPVYVSAMMQRRWGGLPSCATRVEWQIGRAYLKQFGLDTATETMKRMPDVFAKLTDEPGGAFRITAEKPDKENKHQSRAATHPIWERIVEIGRQKIGESTQRLKRLDRSKLDESSAIMQIVGYATSIADRRQTICETRADLIRLIEETMDNHQIGDERILSSFMKKAKASGTWQDIFSFPGKEAA